MNIVITIIILLVYTLVMIKIGGSIPPSLSSSVFNIPTNKRWILTVVIFTVYILVVLTYIEKTDINTQFLSFFLLVGLVCVTWILNIIDLYIGTHINNFCYLGIQLIVAGVSLFIILLLYYKTNKKLCLK